MPILEICNVSKSFYHQGCPTQKAVNEVNLHVDKGECVAIVGESGSGKTTLARLAVGLIRPDSGEIRVAGRNFDSLSAVELKTHRLKIQPVFQDPSGSFNPRRSVLSSLEQALAQRLMTHGSHRHRAMELLAQVGLRPPEDFLGRYPHELSGGQRQRLSIARALAPDPEIIIADEPLSGSDVSIRAQVLNLLMDLRAKSGVAYVLITHDMLVAEAVADRVAVMYRGRIVEEGPTERVINSPRDAYTRRLLAAVQTVDVRSLGSSCGGADSVPTRPELKE